MDGSRRAGRTDRAPDWLARGVVAPEQSAELDRARPVLGRVAASLTGRPGVRDVLAGRLIGHAASRC
jgi:hypothetical protein